MQLGTDEFLIVTVLLDHAAKTVGFFAKRNLCKCLLCSEHPSPTAFPCKECL